MTQEQWTALAARCEAATGSDRDTDALIWNAVYAPGSDLPAGAELTASLDAITALIERQLPGCGLVVKSRLATVKTVARLFLRTGMVSSEDAANPVLALCAAFCRAMAERAEK